MVGVAAYTCSGGPGPASQTCALTLLESCQQKSGETGRAAEPARHRHTGDSTSNPQLHFYGTIYLQNCFDVNFCLFFVLIIFADDVTGASKFVGLRQRRHCGPVQFYSRVCFTIKHSVFVQTQYIGRKPFSKKPAWAEQVRRWLPALGCCCRHDRWLHQRSRPNN